MIQLLENNENIFCETDETKDFAFPQKLFVNVDSNGTLVSKDATYDNARLRITEDHAFS